MGTSGIGVLGKQQRQVPEEGEEGCSSGKGLLPVSVDLGVMLLSVSGGLLVPDARKTVEHHLLLCYV